MQEQNEILGMPGVLTRPAFCVKDGVITQVNEAAGNLFLSPGTDVRELLVTGKDEYAAFCGDCLYLTMEISGCRRGVTVVRYRDTDVFLPEQDVDQAELRALALAAVELRDPLSSVMLSAQKLTAQAEPSEAAARLSRGLYRMLRLVSNMSDAGYYSAVSHPETRNICVFLGEVFEKAQNLAALAGRNLTFENLSEDIYCLVDDQQLERAVLNILSNAIRFSPDGGSIRAKLTRQGHMLSLRIQDSGCGIAEEVLSNVFTRYLRQPSLENPQYGIGLGMVLVRAAAANHGGTVLIDRPDGQGTRVTMTLAIRQSDGTNLRADVLRVDYSGERDHALLELADCLPPELYENC